MAFSNQQGEKKLNSLSCLFYPWASIDYRILKKKKKVDYKILKKSAEEYVAFYYFFLAYGASQILVRIKK